MQKILILDFGGQFGQLIARRVREHHVYCEVVPWTTPLAELRAFDPIGIIFTGGPGSVYLEGSPSVDPQIFTWGVPILGICYGCQLMAHLLGGEVVPAQEGSAREYGRTLTCYGMQLITFWNHTFEYMYVCMVSLCVNACEYVEKRGRDKHAPSSILLVL